MTSIPHHPVLGALTLYDSSENSELWFDCLKQCTRKSYERGMFDQQTIPKLKDSSKPVQVVLTKEQRAQMPPFDNLNTSNGSM